MKRQIIIAAIIAFAAALSAHAGSHGNGKDPDFLAKAAAKVYNEDLNTAKNCEAKGMQKNAFCIHIRDKHPDWYNADGSLKPDLQPH